jgi:hypothetical protein
MHARGLVLPGACRDSFSPAEAPRMDCRFGGKADEPYGQRCMFVANDWHASLVPLYLAARFRPHKVSCACLARHSTLKMVLKMVLKTDTYSCTWWDGRSGCTMYHDERIWVHGHGHGHPGCVALGMHVAPAPYPPALYQPPPPPLLSSHSLQVHTESRCVLALHNLAHQGSFPPSAYGGLGLAGDWCVTCVCALQHAVPSMLCGGGSRSCSGGW